VGFISWFAGLFYVVRLFVYHAEASERSEEERRVLLPQLELMQTRLWSIITTPAMLLTLGAGSYMIYELGTVPGWLRLKLGLLVLLVAYHVTCGVIRRQQLGRTSRWSSRHLRIWNEGATMLMVGIVFLAVFKHAMSVVWGVAGLVALGVVLMTAMRLYRRALARDAAEPTTTVPSPPARDEAQA
jgi:putative membrane protein